MSTPEQSHTPLLNLDNTLDRLRAHLPELRQRYGVVELGVFGSHLRKQTSEANDVDILVEFDERPLSLFDFLALKGELSDILEVEVDLVEKKALKPGIAGRVLQEVIYV